MSWRGVCSNLFAWHLASYEAHGPAWLLGDTKFCQSWHGWHEFWLGFAGWGPAESSRRFGTNWGTFLPGATLTWCWYLATVSLSSLRYLFTFNTPVFFNLVVLALWNWIVKKNSLKLKLYLNKNTDPSQYDIWIRKVEALHQQKKQIRHLPQSWVWRCINASHLCLCQGVYRNFCSCFVKLLNKNPPMPIDLMCSSDQPTSNMPEIQLRSSPLSK